jgi:hypothetical protein
MVSGLIDRPWKKVLAAAMVAGGVWYATQFENCNGRVSNFLKDPSTVVDVHEPNPESTSAPAPQKYTKKEALNLLVNVSGKPNGKNADGTPNYDGEVSCKELQKQEFLRRQEDAPITSTEVDCLNVLVNVSGKSSGKNPDGSANYDGEVSCKDLQQAEFERRRNDTPVDGKKGGQPVYQVPGHEPGTGENLASRLIDVHVEIDQCDAEKTTLGLDRRELYVAAHLALQRSGIPSPKNRQRTIEETVKDLAKVPVKYGCEDSSPCPEVPAQSTPADETTKYNPGNNATTVATIVNLTESVSAATQIDCSKSGGSGVYSVEQLCAPIANCEEAAPYQVPADQLADKRTKEEKGDTCDRLINIVKSKNNDGLRDEVSIYAQGLLPSNFDAQGATKIVVGVAKGFTQLYHNMGCSDRGLEGYDEAGFADLLKKNYGVTGKGDLINVLLRSGGEK